MSDGAADRDARLRELLVRMRVPLSTAAVATGESEARVEQVVTESVPFAESALRAWESYDQPDGEALFREARSYAWLFAYRLGDQSFASTLCGSVVPAWCAASGQPFDHGWTAILHSLILDGYSRGREDRHRAEFQHQLGESLPVHVIRPGMVLCVLSGPLEPDATRRVIERASQLMLRNDCTGLVCDLTGLLADGGAITSELLAAHDAAAMLGGVCAFVTGAEPMRAVLAEHAQGRELRVVDTLAEALTVTHNAVHTGWWAMLVRRLRGTSNRLT